MAVTIGPRLQAFFDQKLAAIVTTVNERGTPEMTPIWYEYADSLIWLNGDVRRKWLARMEESGRVTFFVMDAQNLWRWAQVYGRVVEAYLDEGAVHIDRLSHRYLGKPYGGGAFGPDGRATRRVLKVEITSVKGADGSRDKPWDVTK